MPNGQAPWPFTWDPTPGNFGALYNTLAVALATAGPALVGTTTTSVYIGVPATKTIYIAGASIQGGAVFTGSGAVTATLFKKSGSTSTALTAPYDLTAALSSAGYANVAITATDPQATLAPGDTLRVDVIAAGSLGGGDLRVVVEAALRN